VVNEQNGIRHSEISNEKSVLSIDVPLLCHFTRVYTFVWTIVDRAICEPEQRIVKSLARKGIFNDCFDPLDHSQSDKKMGKVIGLIAYRPCLCTISECEK
jgi:hypothetical protein